MKRLSAFSVLPLAAALFIFSGCGKEPVLDEAPSAKVFTASIGDVTKTTLDQSGEESNFGKVYWTSGDEVSINGVIYVATPGSDATTATLTKKAESDTDPEAPYVACYPASIWNGSEAVFPTRQEYASGADLSGVNPMKAESETTSLSFENMGALVEMVIKGESTKKVLNISFGGYTLLCGTEGVTLSENGSKFYIAVPAGKYETLDYNITLTDGKFQEGSSGDAVELKRNAIYSLNFGELNLQEREAVQLWADGPYWATTNIGAADATDYGLYFEWGNIIGYAPNGTSFSHSFNETDYAKTPGAELDGDITTAAYDAAMAIWGGKWRMPTIEEFSALLSNCDWEWYDGIEKQYYGKPVTGYKFTGRGNYSGKSIFLPAAGYGYESTLFHAGSIGSYWTSTYFSGRNACILYFSSGDAYTEYDSRYYGFPVRPVSD